jgi:hypothetical protein
MTPSSEPAQPAAGEFPFSFADRPTDTAAVKRWRNRSRYLTRGGLWQLAATLYQYNRGVFGNLLLLTPILAALAIAVSFFYTWMRQHPYIGSLLLLIVLLIAHVIDFIAYQDRASTQSVMWQERRNALRSLIVGSLPFVILIESMPLCTENLRHLRPGGSLGINQSIGFLATLASASGVIRFLSPHAWTGRLAMRLAIGILSWLMVATILVGLVDYLYFGIPPYGYFLFVPFIAAGVAIASFSRGATRFIHEWAGFPSPTSRRLAIGLSILSMCVSALIGIAIAFILMTRGIDEYSRQCRFAAESVAEITRPLAILQPALDAASEAPATGSETVGKALTQAIGSAAGAHTAIDTQRITQRVPNPIIDEGTKSLLASLANQKRALDVEGNATWEQDYQTVTLGRYLPFCESRIVTPWLPRGPNRALYQTQAQSGIISQWGLLYPLRPNHHSHAVAFLHSCAELDALTPQAKENLKRSITRYSVRRLAERVAKTSFTADSEEWTTRPRVALQAILVDALVKKLLATRDDEPTSANLNCFTPLVEAREPASDHLIDIVFASVISPDFVLEAVQNTSIPKNDDEL